MNKKTIISWLTIFAFLMTAVPAFAGTASYNNTNEIRVPCGEITVADFGNGSIDGASVMDKGYPTVEGILKNAAIDNTVSYEDRQSSLAYTFGKKNSGILIKMPYDEVWDSEYDIFKMRYYTQIPGQQVMVVINNYDPFTVSGDKYMQNKITTDGDWSELSVNMSSIRTFWENDEPEYIYVYITTNGWGISEGTSEAFQNGTAQSVIGEKMYIDEIRLSNSSYGAPMPAPVSSVENNSGFVSPELDGDNSLTFTYEKDIYAFDSAVKLYETAESSDSGIEYVESDISYSVEANQNKLNVIFDSPLPDNNYRIVVLRDKVVSLSGEMAENDVEIYFSVGQESVLFNVSEVSFKDGDVFDVPPSEIFVTFGTEPDRSLYVPDYIFLYHDGEKVYNAFSYELNEKTLKLIFENPLIPGNYTLKISGSYANIYGNSIIGNAEYHFEIISKEETESPKSIMMFEAGNADDMSNAVLNSGGSALQYSEVTNLYDTTAMLNIVCGEETEFALKNKFGLSGMKYVNFLIYNQEASNDDAEFRLYTDFAKGKSAKYPYALSWSGWELISLPLEDFKGDITYDAVGVRHSGTDAEDTNRFILIDAIWASEKLPAGIEFVSSSFPEGFGNATTLGEVLELTYSCDINSKILPVVEVSDESGNKITDFRFFSDSDTVRIEFGYLTPCTGYEVRIRRVVSADLTIAPEKHLSFSTSDAGVCLEDVAMSGGIVANESSDVTFLLSNSGKTDCEITLCVMVSGNEYNPAALVQKKINLPANTVIHSEALAVTPNEGTKAVKAYALMPSGRMLSQKYCVADGSEVKLLPVSYDSETKAKIASVSLNVNVLDIMAETAKKSDTVIITVENGSGQTVFADIVSSENKTIKKYFEFSEAAPSGEYTVKVICGSSEDERKVSYISASDRKAVVDAANSGKKDEVKRFINSNSVIFGLEDASSDFIDEISALVAETGGFDVYADIGKLICQITEAFDSANNAVWADFTELISGNPILFGGSEDKEYAYYMSLSEKNQNKICMKIQAKMPVDSLYELNRAFESAIDDYKASLESGGGGSSGGGKKGGSDGSSVISDLPYNVPAPYTPAQTANEFSDLADASWAAESIMKLREEGIVSASADKLFRPNDNITREEFIKLIICAFAPDEAESQHSFTDAPENAWFAPYVKKAHHLGILKGYPDGSFGAGQSITREDMVTLIGRTLEALGLEIKSGDALKFTDANAISAYAGKYVGALAELGIVNGMGNGSFAPKETATRAQSAKVIAGLIEKY